MADQRGVADPEEVAVIIPAAGRGSRLGGERKQFRTLGEQPLLVQTLRVFERHPAVGHAVVVAPESHVSEVEDRLQVTEGASLTAVVAGGDSRRASVHCGLRAVPSAVEIVLVHDAVRPFVQANEVGAVIDAVREEGAASLALPVADTLRHASDRVFEGTVPRGDLFRMQTPQGFRRSWLTAAHRAALQNEWSATDDVGLVQRTGRSVHLVEGSRHNFKITRPGDWELAQTLWPAWNGTSSLPSAEGSTNIEGSSEA